MSSSSARSRNGPGPSPRDAASSSRSTSEVEMALGSRRGWSGGRTSPAGSMAVKPSWAQNLCQPRTATTARADDDAERTARPSEPERMARTKDSTSSSTTWSTVARPRTSRYAVYRARSRRYAARVFPDRPRSTARCARYWSIAPWIVVTATVGAPGSERQEGIDRDHDEQERQVGDRTVEQHHLAEPAGARPGRPPAKPDARGQEPPAERGGAGGVDPGHRRERDEQQGAGDHR